MKSDQTCQWPSTRSALSTPSNDEMREAIEKAFDREGGDAPAAGAQAQDDVDHSDTCSDSRTRGSGEVTIHPTDEAGPKPAESAGASGGGGEERECSGSFLNSIYDDDDNTNSPGDPRISLTRPANGRIDIWVGTYDGSVCDATLNLETFYR